MEVKRRKLNPAESEESLRLLKILPEEVWLQVWKNINQSADYFQICAFSRLFGRLGLTQRTRILLDAVAQVLPKYIHEKQFLKIRKVCRSWKQAVDKSFQQNWENCEKIKFADYDEVVGTTKWENNIVVEGLYERNQIQRFLEHFEETHQKANPFVGRRLTITIHSSRIDFNDSMQVLTHLLEKYGAHVWQCTIRISCDRGTGIICIDILKQILQHLTSLKHLCLKSVCYLLLEDTEIQAIEQKSLNTVKTLQKLTETYTPASLLMTLLKSNPQIKMLDSETFCRNANKWHQQLEMGLLHNLQKLAITTIESSAVYNVRVFPQLRVLYLKHDDDDDEEDADENDLELQVLHQLAERLEETYTELTEEEGDGLIKKLTRSDLFWVKFPKLKQVHCKRQDKFGLRSFLRKNTLNT